jgi:hypothetical protein
MFEEAHVPSNGPEPLRFTLVAAPCRGNDPTHPIVIQIHEMNIRGQAVPLRNVPEVRVDGDVLLRGVRRLPERWTT